MIEPQHHIQHHDAQAAQAARAPTHLTSSEFATTSKLSRKTAQASPIMHYRSRSHNTNSLYKEPHDVARVASTPHLPSRVMPSPLPPPSAALPPTPGQSVSPSPTLNAHRFFYRSSNGSAYAAPSILDKSFRKTLRSISVGLTQQEHLELVQKILTDLRPVSLSATIRSSSRASRPVSIASSRHTAVSHMTVDHKTLSLASDQKRLSASWHSDEARSISSHASQSSDDKSKPSSFVSVSKSSTPQLSQSRTPTPNTPGGPMTRDNVDEKASALTAKATSELAMSPSAALESLRVLESSFDRSAASSPRNARFSTQDTDLSETTMTVASSPTKSTHHDDNNNNNKQAPSIRQAKRNSSYRKSVPSLDELADKNGLGISAQNGQQEGYPSKQAPSSPSTATHSETSTWISSLTTFEAIRVLAFQQDVVSETCVSPSLSSFSSGSKTAADAVISSDEVSALRVALKFTLARADKLAEALNRTKEDKLKAETELEILRKNVLSMLGSKNMFTGGRASPSHHPHRLAADADLVEEEELDGFEDARSRQGNAGVKQSAGSLAAVVSRPPRAARAAKSATSSAALKPASVASASIEPKPSGGVSIASLRKNASASGVASSAAQRYEPSHRDAACVDNHHASDGEDEDQDDEEYDMYPFGGPPPRRAAAEVSMTDFLNASRMSRSEIAEHDARRELDVSDDLDHYSISSHAPVKTGGRSIDAHRRGFFKGITKLVDSERTKRSTRRSSVMLISKPTTGASSTLPRSASSVTPALSTSDKFTPYNEDSIIPAYPDRTSSRSTDCHQHAHRYGTIASLS